MDFRYWFNDIEKIFKDFHRENKVLDFDDKNKRRIFIDNGAKILFIAHLDTVQKPLIRKIKKGRIYGAGFDDRAGCYCAYELSKTLKADVLLCDNEESGCSSALYHQCKEYNWILELDRSGTDFVEYDTAPFSMIEAAKKYFKEGIGSFSDIAFLDTKCAAINCGIGYQHAHSKDSYIVLDDMEKQLKRIKRFYEHNKDIKYNQPTKSNWGIYGRSRIPYAGYYNYGQDLKDDCYSCRRTTCLGCKKVAYDYATDIEESDEISICDFCGEKAPVRTTQDAFTKEYYCLCLECRPKFGIVETHDDHKEPETNPQDEHYLATLPECFICTTRSNVKYYAAHDCYLCDYCADRTPTNRLNRKENKK